MAFKKHTPLVAPYEPANLSGAQSWTGNQYPDVISLADTATVEVDASLSNSFKLILGGNRTLALAKNVVAGMSWTIDVVQDSTGGRTLDTSAYDWGDEGAPDFSADLAGEKNLLTFYASSATHIYATVLSGF